METSFRVLVIAVCSAASFSACSHIEYEAQKKTYTRLNSLESSQFTSSGLNQANSTSEPVLRKKQEKSTEYRTPAFLQSSSSGGQYAISKQDSKRLGYVYMGNSFAPDSPDMVFEIRRDRYGYTATTPLTFSTPNFQSGLSFSIDRRKALVAGIQFAIPFHY